MSGSLLLPPARPHACCQWTPRLPPPPAPCTAALTHLSRLECLGCIGLVINAAESRTYTNVDINVKMNNTVSLGRAKVTLLSGRH